MKIDRDLKLVVPLEVEAEERDEKGDVARPARTFYVHSTPVSYEVFEEHAFLFAKAFTKTLSAGPTMGPRIASLMLRDAARETYGEDVVTAKNSGYAALMAEIRRLSMVIVPTERGFEPLPLEEAFSRGMIERADVSRVEGGIVFFTLVWHMMAPAERTAMTYGVIATWGGSITSSNPMDYALSLTTSTPPASTGASPAPASSVPS